MQFTDTHAHYFDRKFDALPGGAQGILNDPAFRASVRAVINIGTNLQNSREAVAQAARYPFMAAAVGIHPEDCQVYPGAPGWYEGQKPLEPEEELPDYPVTAFVSREGYFKKITPQSLRASGEQKFKEGDGLAFAWETTNRAELLVFTDQFQCYKARLSDFDDGKASQLGDYLPTKLSMDPGENVVQTVFPGDYSGFVLFFFESGKVAKVPLSSYDTKSNRRKLTGAYSDKSPLRTVLAMEADGPVVAYSTDGRAMIFSSAQLTPKTTRATQGVAVLTLRKKSTLDRAVRLAESGITNQARYKCRALPAAGAVLRTEDLEEKQITWNME